MSVWNLEQIHENLYFVYNCLIIKTRIENFFCTNVTHISMINYPATFCFYWVVGVYQFSVKYIYLSKFCIFYPNIAYSVALRSIFSLSRKYFEKSNINSNNSVVVLIENNIRGYCTPDQFLWLFMHFPNKFQHIGDL